MARCSSPSSCWWRWWRGRAAVARRLPPLAPGRAGARPLALRARRRALPPGGARAGLRARAAGRASTSSTTSRPRPTNLLYGADRHGGAPAAARAALRRLRLPGPRAARARGAGPRRRDARRPTRPPRCCPRVWVPGGGGPRRRCFVLLSLGRDIVGVRAIASGPGPIGCCTAGVPGFQLVRIPERLGLLAMLFVALLAGTRAHPAGGARPRGGSVAPGRAGSPRAPRAAAPSRARARRARRARRLSLAGRAPRRRGGRGARSTARGSCARRRWRCTSPRITVQADHPRLHRLPAAAHAPPPAPGRASSRPRRRCRRSSASAWTPSSCITGGRSVSTSRGGSGTPAQYDSGDVPPLAAARRAGPLRSPARRRGRRAHRVARRGSKGRRPASSRARRTRSTACPPGRRTPAAPFPAGRAPCGIRRGAIAPSSAIPTPAADGDRATAWVVPRFLLGDEFFEVAFGRPILVRGRRAAAAPRQRRSRRASAWPGGCRPAAGPSWRASTRATRCSSSTACGTIRAPPPSASTSAARDAGRDQPPGGRGGDELRGLVASGGGGVGAGTRGRTAEAHAAGRARSQARFHPVGEPRARRFGLGRPRTGVGARAPAATRLPVPRTMVCVAHAAGGHEPPDVGRAAGHAEADIHAARGRRRRPPRSRPARRVARSANGDLAPDAAART